LSRNIPQHVGIKRPQTPPFFALVLQNITKKFGSVIALDEVSVSIKQNEIYGIVGQNGSGKSTLSKIIVGAEKPDTGSMEWCGKPISPGDPGAAEELGLFIVYQESFLPLDLLVYQWLFLNREERKLWHLDIPRMKRQTRSILKELKINCHPNDCLKDLDMATRKMLEIARAWLRLSRVGSGVTRMPLIILDEPTGHFSKPERDFFFERIKEVKEKATFVFISHILPEVLELCDRICVLRDGKVVSIFDQTITKLEEAQVHVAMLGKEIASTHTERVKHKGILLRIENLSKSGVYFDVSFELYAGEVLGVTGPIGSGKSEIGRTIAGLMKQDSGVVLKDGKPLNGSPSERMEKGVGYFSGDRTQELFLQWPMTKNISIINLERVSRRLLAFMQIIDPSKEYAIARSHVEKLNISPPDPKRMTRYLSGGNKQKVAIAKWIERDPDVFVMENPTLGVDIGAREDIYEIFLKMKDEGKGLLLVSDDLNEIDRLSDRIIYVGFGRVESVIDRYQTPSE
jgi:ribose transport system ATP-binding protein